MMPWGICLSFSHYALHFTESVVVRVNEFLNTISKANPNILHSGSKFNRVPNAVPVPGVENAQYIWIMDAF